MEPQPVRKRVEGSRGGALTPPPRGFTWYAALTVTAVAGHHLLPATARPLSYSLISATTLLPLGLLVRRSARHARLPWALVLVAMTLLAAGSWITAADGGRLREVGDQVVTAGHTVLLLGALALVLMRGRNDIGGLIDTGVALMGLGSLLWAGLLQPRLAEARMPLGTQVALLVTIFVLSGVLGALSRLWFVGGRRLLTLHLLVYALLIALVGNTALALTTGSMTADRPRWVETLFLIAYLCVGSAALHPSAHELSRPGPAPVDRLSGGRLIFLGAAMVANPVLGGGRQLLGLPADGLLIAVGTLAVAPFVMLRIHRLSVERQQAEHALVHQATHDALTGLPNRAELLSRLSAALDREGRAGHPRVVLLFCDLDGFKGVNDRFGHAAGDALLREVATRLRTRLPHGDTVARYGGDEFLILSENASAAAITGLHSQIDDALATPIRLGGEPVRIRASVGAVVSDGATDADELVRRADESMYRAKPQRRPTPVHPTR
ncbi:diguanylate cyclase (GGDEF) domain-containing protein [Micromonospora pattaloongensis]|uniref:Diguanylate cyclase (GGDEF) domain-containing protein n=1 Tax=Micromonospora pattaloongensis TaxID=405436 RepID=A0A1H3P4G1_9ACTN|nr:GGDEF domain-containing protein [Micromonospora pattaloongensis]SDY95958.1 diguanylate cyclase (GGDEF) domain-containing protein [Micromonospora pattaloongensis]